jgi:hypothetical protein
MVAVGDEVPMNVHETDERLGSLVQNTMTSEVRFRAELSEYGIERW